MKEHTLILVNPAAGSGAGNRIHLQIESLLQGGLSGKNGRIHIERTDPEGLVAQARNAASRYSSIIAVGGDGTASQIIEGIFESGSETAFGLLPLGTGNDLARTLGTFPPMLSGKEAVLKIALLSLLRGKTRVMDLLEMEGAGRFVNYVGFGFDAAVLAGYLAFKERSLFRLFQGSRILRFLTYGVFLFRKLPYRLPPGIEIRLGNEGRSFFSGRSSPHQAIVIGNIPYYAGGFLLAPEADPDDGRFEVTLIRGPIDIFRILLTRVTPLRRRTENLHRVQTDRLEWSAPPGVPFQRDGELSPAPLPSSGTVKIAGRVKVLVPEEMAGPFVTRKG